MNAKKMLIIWLESGDTQRVLTGLGEICNRWGNNEQQSATTLQISRFNNLKRQHNEQTISHLEYQLESAKIRKALLDLIANLDDQWTSEALKNIPPTKGMGLTKNKLRTLTIFLIILILAGVPMFFGSSIKNIFIKKPGSTQTLIPQSDTTPTIHTSGNNSPIIIHEGQGDVNFNVLQEENKDSLKNK